MWYFAWILGVLLAVAFGIINVMWYESEQCLGDPGDDPQPDRPRGGDERQGGEQRKDQLTA
jgi:cyd operon protein YbgT